MVPSLPHAPTRGSGEQASVLRPEETQLGGDWFLRMPGPKAVILAKSLPRIEYGAGIHLPARWSLQPERGTSPCATACQRGLLLHWQEDISLVQVLK